MNKRADWCHNCGEEFPSPVGLAKHRIARECAVYKQFDRYWAERLKLDPAIESQRENVEHAFHVAWTLHGKRILKILEKYK